MQEGFFNRIFTLSYGVDFVQISKIKAVETSMTVEKSFTSVFLAWEPHKLNF